MNKLTKAADALNIREELLDTGHWVCPDSPIGICVYDVTSEYGYDECVICGEPDERK